MRALQALALGAQLAAAISFSDPAENATLTRGATFDLRWTSVDTDPTAFSVYLVNFVNWPPYYAPLALNLETSAGEASVRVPCDVDGSYGYQFNAINGTNVYVIYAQTPQFSITGDSCTDLPVAPTAAAPTCAAAATVTVTVRGNSSFTSGSGGAATATTTFQGTCPSTIGWSGNYSHPVTLSSTPHAGRGVATATPTGAPATSAAVSFGAGLYWNSTVTVPAVTGAEPAAATATAVSGLLTGAEKAKTGSCSKKRQPRKRHSDNGRTRPWPRKR